MTEINQELFQKIYDQIVMHPETHDQYGWEVPGDDVCDTTRCVAGWAIALSGESVLKHLDNGEVASRASELLGLRPATAMRLFYTSNAKALEAVESYALKGKYEEERYFD